VAERDNELAAERAKVAERDNELAAERAKVAERDNKAAEMPTRKEDWECVVLNSATRQRDKSGVSFWGGECCLVPGSIRQWIKSKDIDINEKGITIPAENRGPVVLLDHAQDRKLRLSWYCASTTDQKKIEGYKRKLETVGLCVEDNNKETWIRFSEWKYEIVGLGKPATIETSVCEQFQFAFEGGEWQSWDALTTKRFPIPENAGFIVFKGSNAPPDPKSGSKSTGRYELTVTYEWPENLSDERLQKLPDGDTGASGANAEDKGQNKKEKFENQRQAIAELASKQKILLGLKGEVPTHQLTLEIVYPPPAQGVGP
jgi:hypothetical protein